MSMFQALIDEYKSNLDTPLIRTDTIASMENFELNAPFSNTKLTDLPYTPINIQKTDDGLKIHCYMIGFIDTIDKYVDLINVLEYGVDETSEVIININSPGGYLNTGAMVASAIENSKAHVTTVATGLCGSAAALIWSSGHTCEFSEFSTFLFHMSSHSACGQPSTAIKQEADLLIGYVNQILLVAKDKKHITEDEYYEISVNGSDIYVTADQMKQRLNIQEEDDMIQDGLVVEDDDTESVTVTIENTEITDTDDVSNTDEDRLTPYEEGPYLDDDLFDIQEGDK